MSIFSFINPLHFSPQKKFWKWFVKHRKVLFEFEKDRENIFDNLAAEMNKVHPALTFEFGPILKNRAREFVISAGGIKEVFPFVQALYDAAPNLPEWSFIKFRPRRKFINDIKFDRILIKVSDVYYRIFKDQDKVGLIMFIEGCNNANKDIYRNIGYLFLDDALGEYDVEMKVGFIEIESKESKYFGEAQPLLNLAQHFDEYYEL